MSVEDQRSFIWGLFNSIEAGLSLICLKQMSIEAQRRFVGDLFNSIQDEGSFKKRFLNSKNAGGTNPGDFSAPELLEK